MADLLDKFGKFLLFLIIIVFLLVAFLFGTSNGKEITGNIIAKFTTPKIDGIELKGELVRTCWEKNIIQKRVFPLAINQNLLRVSYNKFQVGQLVDTIEKEGQLFIIGEKYYWGRLMNNPDYLRLLIINQDCSIDSEDVHINQFNELVSFI